MTRKVTRWTGDAESRFWAQVAKGDDNECWLWTGSLVDGYGRIRVGAIRMKAHRFAYELLIGPIPSGLQIDHTCHNNSNCQGGSTCIHRRCVNPAHLEPVTNSVNAKRGRTGQHGKRWPACQ